MSGWVLCKERLPEIGAKVLIYDGLDFDVAIYTGVDDDYFWDCDNYGYRKQEITHWKVVELPK